MDSLIDIDKLIRKAKKEGVSFGKGDPYNRLRYYTKIGWLPHMTRRKNKAGNVRGHYPNWVLERIILIENYKKQGLSNDDISKKVGTRSKIHDFYARFNSQDFRNKIISYATVTILLIIFLNELDVINLSKSKNRDILLQTQNVPTQIVSSGVSFVPSDEKNVFIKTTNIGPNSKVYVTFKQSFSPATRYWVSQIDSQKGFYVELDAPVFDNSEFSWWVSN